MKSKLRESILWIGATLSFTHMELQAAAFAWSGSIEHATASYELGGDFYTVSNATQDIIVIPSQYGASFSVTLTSGTWPAIKVFPTLPNSSSGQLAPSTMLGNTLTWIQPAFNPDPDANAFPPAWYMVVSAETEGESLWYDAPMKNATGGVASYSFSIDGPESLTVKEGVLIPPDGVNGMRGRFIVHNLPVPEPTIGVLSMLGLIALATSRHRR